MSVSRGDVFNDIIAPFLSAPLYGEGIDPVDFIRIVAGAAVIHADTNPEALTATQHQAVTRLQEYAVRQASEANVQLVRR